MKKTASVLALAAAAALAAGSASAAVIDFESVATGTYSSLTTGGVTFTFTAGTGTFDVIASGSPGAPIAGNALLSYLTNPGPGAFKATMAGGFGSFAIGCGDYNADEDHCHLSAYDAAGGLLDAATYINPASTYGGGMLSVASATPIAYVTFWEDYVNPGAVYWDNVEFTAAAAVPEPQTYALLALGLAAIGFTARRRKAG